MNYHLTQLLTGHGRYGSYLKRMELAQDDGCWYCEERHPGAHTVRLRKTEGGERAENKCGVRIKADNIVEIMHQDEAK